jgi:hypothetical protein
MFNIVVGTVWITSLVALPEYILIRRFDDARIALGIVLVTAVILKFTWYDNLSIEEETDVAPQRGLGAAPAAITTAD